MGAPICLAKCKWWLGVRADEASLLGLPLGSSKSVDVPRGTSVRPRSKDEVLKDSLLHTRRVSSDPPKRRANSGKFSSVQCFFSAE